MGLWDVLGDASNKFSSWLSEGETSEPSELASVFDRALKRVGRGLPREEESQETLSLTPSGILDAGDITKLTQKDARDRGYVESGGKVAPYAATAGWLSGANPSGLAGSPAIGSPRYGWIRAAPSEVGRVKEALKDMGDTAADFMQRSPKEYRFRQGDLAEAKANWPPERLPYVGGWADRLPGNTGSVSILREEEVKNALARGSNWPVEATAHEGGHMMMNDAAIHNVPGVFP